jgi:hypothetical protein
MCRVSDLKQRLAGPSDWLCKLNELDTLLAGAVFCFDVDPNNVAVLRMVRNQSSAPNCFLLSADLGQFDGNDFLHFSF